MGLSGPAWAAPPPTALAAPPPTQAGAMPPRESRWPSIVGIISIICASVAIFRHGVCTPIDLVGAALSSQLFEDLGQTRPGLGAQSEQLAVVGEYLPWSIAVSVSSVALAVVLLVGGVKLTRRRPDARTIILTWAVLKMVHATGAAFLSYTMGQAQIVAMQEAVAQSGGPAQIPAGFMGIVQGIGLIGAVMTLLFLWALPLFVLVWFNRRAIRAETDGWRLTSTARPPVSPASG